MSEQTGIANSIDIAKQEAQYDSCAKKLLSNTIILAWILKECVPEFKRYSVAQIANDCIEVEPQVSKVAVDQDQLDKDELEYLEDMSDKSIKGKNTEDNSVKEGIVFYDIKFSAVVPDTKEPVQLFINIEAQKDDKTPYPLIKRGLYYVSRMISAQKNTVFTKSHYEKIRKVYSIWIHLNVDEHENSITKYRVSEEQVVGDYHELETNYDLLTVLMLKLGPAGGAENHPILKLLDVLLSPDTKPDEKKIILERDFDIPMTKSMREEADAMCNLGQGIRERAVIESTGNTIIKIMINKNLSFDDAYDSIYCEEDRDDIKAYVDEHMAVAK